MKHDIGISFLAKDSAHWMSSLTSDLPPISTQATKTMSDKPAQNNSEYPAKPGIEKPIYERVVHATQSGISLTGNETDLLGKEKTVYENRGHQEPRQVVADPENNATHRIDAPHEIPAESHLALRLKKFMQLSARYAKKAPAQTDNLVSESIESASVESASVEPASVEPASVATSEPDVQEPQTSPDSDWTDDSPMKAAGFKLKTIHNQLDAAITTQGSVAPHPDHTQIRVDQPQTLEQRQLHTLPTNPPSTSPDQELNEFATPVSTGIVWEVESFRWPEVSQELIGEGSLAIDRLGNNALKLMTGVQNRLVVTGTNRGEGVTTIAISLAQWAASLGHRVLLVDGDLERAGLTKMVGLDGDISWTKVANKQCKIGEALVLGKESGVYVLPLARVDNRANFPSDLFNELGKAIEPISDCFNLVIVDVGPSRQLTRETNRIDLLGDATMLIHDVSRTIPQDFEKNKSHLLGYGISKMLVAENFTRDPNRQNG